MKKIILLTFLFIFFVCADKTFGATLYAGSATQTVYEGQTFVVEWYINSGNQPINAVNVGLYFSTSTIKLIDVSTAGSGVSLWVKNPQESVSGAVEGTITALGGVPAGVFGYKIPLFRTTFMAVKSGVANFGIIPGSKTFRSDGRGTNDDLSFNPLTFNIGGESAKNVAYSTTHTDQQKWYHQRNAKIFFDVDKNKEYSYSFSANPEIIPSNTPVTTDGKFSFKDLNDGLYYFKLASRVAGGAWQENAVYRVQIDTTAPEKFTPVVSEGQLIFNTTDKTSGINSYKVKSGLFGLYYDAKSPTAVSRPWIGDGFTVLAYDNSGNYQKEFIAYPGVVGTKTFIFLLLIVFCIVAVVYNRKHIRSWRILKKYF